MAETMDESLPTIGSPEYAALRERLPIYYDLTQEQKQDGNTILRHSGIIWRLWQLAHLFRLELTAPPEGWKRGVTKSEVQQYFSRREPLQGNQGSTQASQNDYNEHGDSSSIYSDGNGLSSSADVDELVLPYHVASPAEYSQLIQQGHPLIRETPPSSFQGNIPVRRHSHASHGMSGPFDLRSNLRTPFDQPPTPPPSYPPPPVPRRSVSSPIELHSSFSSATDSRPGSVASTLSTSSTRSTSSAHEHRAESKASSRREWVPKLETIVDREEDSEHGSPSKKRLSPETLYRAGTFSESNAGPGRGGTLQSSEPQASPRIPGSATPATRTENLSVAENNQATENRPTSPSLLPHLDFGQDLFSSDDIFDEALKKLNREADNHQRREPSILRPDSQHLSAPVTLAQLDHKKPITEVQRQDLKQLLAIWKLSPSLADVDQTKSSVSGASGPTSGRYIRPASASFSFETGGEDITRTAHLPVSSAPDKTTDAATARTMSEGEKKDTAQSFLSRRGAIREARDMNIDEEDLNFSAPAVRESFALPTSGPAVTASKKRVTFGNANLGATAPSAEENENEGAEENPWGVTKAIAKARTARRREEFMQQALARAAAPAPLNPTVPRGILRAASAQSSFLSPLPPLPGPPPKGPLPMPPAMVPTVPLTPAPASQPANTKSSWSPDDDDDDFGEKKKGVLGRLAGRLRSVTSSAALHQRAAPSGPAPTPTTLRRKRSLPFFFKKKEANDSEEEKQE